MCNACYVNNSNGFIDIVSITYFCVFGFGLNSTT